MHTHTQPLHTVISEMTVKPCRHFSSLSLGKLTDKLEQTSPLKLNSCSSCPSAAETETASACFTCLTCLESFCDAGSTSHHLIQHSRIRNHPLFFCGDAIDSNVAVEDAFYCALCGNRPRIREPGKKERITLEKITNLFHQNQKNPIKFLEIESSKDTLSSNNQQDQDYVGSVPNGIINLGNTCFMNSALQLLAATLHRHGPINSYSSSVIWNSLSHHLEEIYSKNPGTKKSSRRSSSSSDSSVNPREFLSLLCGKQKKFASMQQQDAHDFLRLLFNSIPESTSSSSSSNSASSSNTNSNTNVVVTPQIELFGGKFVSRVVCDRCRRVSDMTEPFLDISLSLPSSDISLEDSLSNLSLSSADSADDLVGLIRDWNKKIILEGENGYHCESCSLNDSECLQKATLQFSFVHLPPFLIFHLQRFKTRIRAAGGKKRSGMVLVIEKDDRSVSFPLKLTIPSECSLDSDATHSYQLYGYIIHEGSSTSSGHYTAVLSPSATSDRWYYVSDTRVKEISKSKALDGESYTPYLLFYQKIN